MHKCPQCKTEFGGRFCPECGLEWTEEKTCPKCNAIVVGSARFCETCGYSFVQVEKSVPQEHLLESKSQEQSSKFVQPITPKIKQQAVNRPTMIFTLSRYMPMLLLIVFAALMLIFFSVNIAVLPGMTAMGIPIPAQNYGSIFGKVLENMPEITGIVVSLIIFTALAFVYSLALIIVLNKKELKHYRVLFFGKYDLLLFEVLSIFSPIIYVVFIILGGALMGRLKSLDGGSGLVEIAAYPKLLLIFSIIFFVLALVFTIVRLAKYNTFLNQGGGMSESRKKELAEFYATHMPPEDPRLCKMYTKEQVAVYMYDKHRYDNGKEGKTSSAVIWFSCNRSGVVAIVIIISIIAILLATLIPYNLNIFRVGKVEKIGLGFTKQQVEDILGEPYDEVKQSENGGLFADFGSGLIDSVIGGGTTDNSKTMVKWRYFSKDYAKLRRETEAQLNSIGFKGGVDAVISGGLGGLTSAATGIATVLSNLYSKVYDYIEVDFDFIDEKYQVVRVIFEKSRCDAKDNKKREIKNTSADLLGTVYYYEDFTASNKTVKLVTNNSGNYGSSYTTYFEGGSFVRSYIIKYNLSSMTDGAITVDWKDAYAEYSAQSKNITRLGYVTNGGVWINERIIGTVDYLPASVKTIGNNAFMNSGLEAITIPNGVTSITSGAFSGCGKLTSITIPNSVTSIGDNAFRGCGKLTSITIPNSVTSIGDEAFYGCSSLTSITIPNSVTRIENYAFYGCSSLTSIEIPNGVTSIGNQAFYGCSSLTSITIPNSVTSIGNQAFYACSSLTSITIPNSVTSIGSWAFADCPIETATIPIMAVRYIKKGSLRAVVIIGGESVERDAFSGCSSLTSITIPNSVTSIGNQAFSGCSSLTSITIPNSVTSIGVSVFNGCRRLTSITIPNSVTSIGDSAFYNCSSLTSIEIPNSVTSIGSGAFHGCSSLTSITIPNSVTSIGNQAFRGCNSLTSIKYNSTKGQWKAINKDSDWNRNTGEYTITCTDGTLAKSESE